MITCVVGARPNFMKMAPVVAALRELPSVRTVLVHTGQHYDAALSRVFFEELSMPAPDVNLEVGSGTHAAQTARVLERFDALLETAPPRLVVVAGDVNSTVACALAAAKRTIPVAHVECSPTFSSLLRPTRSRISSGRESIGRGSTLSETP
jgi:UDP-N-acetylglucosamine 2-epimerase (non-hydrolysing)